MMIDFMVVLLTISMTINRKGFRCDQMMMEAVCDFSDMVYVYLSK